MKKLLKSLMLVAAAAMSLTSCENEIMNEGIDTNETFTLSFTAGAPESKTSVEIDGTTATYSWSEGDEVAFIQWANGAEKINKNKSGAAAIEGNTATFTSSFSKVDGTVTSYDYAAIYPDASWSKSVSFAEVHAKLPAMQNLTAGSFDPKADLMMSKAILGVAEKDGHGGNLEFTRIAAIGKMNLQLTDMVEGEVIENVRFAFAEGTHFNGPVVLDFVNSTYTLGTEDTTNAVTLTGELAANTDRTEIFFTCFPGEYSGAYTIEVETDKAKYSKEGNLTNPLSFTAGDVLSFNATAANREEKIVAANEVVDVLNRALTGVTSTSYTTWSGKTSNSDAVYAGQSAGGNESIQLRSKNSNSGIVTTTSGGYAKKVVVTWNSNTSNGRTLNIYGKNSAYTAPTDLYDNSKQGTKLGTIVCGTSTELVINGDYEYIGMRSNSDAMYISEINITWAGAGQGGETPDPEEPETPVDPDPEVPTELAGEGKGTAEDPYDVTRLLAKIENKDIPTDNIYVKGIISQIKEVNTQYGNASFYISVDGTKDNHFQIYRGKYLNNTLFTSEEQIIVSDEVVVYGKLGTYQEAYQFTEGTYITSLNRTKLVMSTITCTNNGVNENSLTFSWSSVENATSYEVSLNGVSKGTITETSYTATGLEAGETYVLSVKAIGTGFTTSDEKTCEGTTKVPEGVVEPETADATLSFANKAQRTGFSTTQQVWEQNGITFKNEKSSSTNNVADYANPVRLYANSKVTVTAPGNITKIVFDCNSSSYATAMKNSIGTVSGATVTVSSDKVTVAFTSAVESFTVAKLTAQVRMDSLTVTYEN